MIFLLACTGTIAGTAPFQLVQVAEKPVVTAIVSPPKGPDIPWLASAPGQLWIVGAPTPALDISDHMVSGGETGLLGLAFHPAWPEDPRIFVNYTYLDSSKKLWTRISSFRTNTTMREVDPTSEVEILTFRQPYSNHNSGALDFGPDGMLYAAIGDGGSGGDPQGTGQDRSDFLGSILRLDVSSVPYKVPADNPFVGEAGVRPEIWLYGVRNPWGMHFDGAQLYFADVGQDKWEEVNRAVKGGNYGWNRLEATHCFKDPACSAAGTIAPLAEYSHSEGRSVTGGVVYRGPKIPALDSRYLYADFAMGKLWALPTEGGPPSLVTTLKQQPISFGTDRAGRLYLADYAGGVYRVDPP